MERRLEQSHIPVTSRGRAAVRVEDGEQCFEVVVRDLAERLISEPCAIHQRKVRDAREDVLVIVPAVVAVPVGRNPSDVGAGELLERRCRGRRWGDASNPSTALNSAHEDAIPDLPPDAVRFCFSFLSGFQPPTELNVEAEPVRPAATGEAEVPDMRTLRPLPTGALTDFANSVVPMSLWHRPRPKGS